MTRQDRPDETWTSYDVPDASWLAIENGKIVALDSPPIPQAKNNWRYDQDSIKNRPALAAHIGTIAAMWSQIEATLGLIFSQLLGSHAVVGTAMYLSIISEQARDSAMKAAANEKLPAELKDKFEVLMSELKGPRKTRNKIVHGLWAISDHHEDCLILIDTRKMIRYWSFNNSPMIDFASRRIDAMKDHVSSTAEYRESDFLQIEDQISLAMRKVGVFQGELFRYLHPELFSREEA